MNITRRHNANDFYDKSNKIIHMIEKWKRVKTVTRNGIVYDVIQNEYTIKIYVSNHGRIKRVNKRGEEIITHGSKTSTGYREVCVTYDNCGKPVSSRFGVHILVASAFNHKPENTTIPNHLDGKKHNNHTTNLEWSTYSENNKHAYITNLKSNRGEKHSQSKLDNTGVIMIADMIVDGYSNKQIIENIKKYDYDIKIFTITDIRNKRSWTHLTSNYNFPRDKSRNHKNVLS